MAANLEIATASLTDVGLTRSENQDFWGEFEFGGERLLIVADGMGGHRGGAAASRLCVDSVARVFKQARGTPEERLRRGLEQANDSIYRAAWKETGLNRYFPDNLQACGNHTLVAWSREQNVLRRHPMT